MFFGMLTLKNVHFSYFKKKILNGVSLHIEKGEIVSLVGASGSGKTTLFKLITGLIREEEGEISINGKPHPEGAYDVTYMQQEDLLLPWRTVLNNLLLLSELGEITNTPDIARAHQLLESVGLKEAAHLYPHELSGGMRQRVALARSLFLKKKPLLLLDEPFGSLDVLIREELYELLRKIASSEKITILFVTHDFRDAIALSNRILILANHEIKDSIGIPANARNKPEEMGTLMSVIREKLGNRQQAMQ